ncbi:MAG: DUF1446 domain-containing protein [Polyangiaceae bacterium]|nr:DUF1446 domain-containing protein [Polyangiaceae bacterium]
MPKRPIRIANASGFLGDRASALAEMVFGGDIDVVSGDYLAEITMQILAKQRDRDPSLGFAASFLHHLEPAFAKAIEKGVKIVVNAGGLNPDGLAKRTTALAQKLGLTVRIATVHGDDLAPRLAELTAAGETFTNLETGEALPSDPGFVRTANAYLGGWGIARALEAGADIVICPRVTDASLAVGPAAWWHGWKRDDWDRLAGAIAAGHVIECGPQATGGNFSGFLELAGPKGVGDARFDALLRPGFPIAEIADDGSSVITKHPNTGGRVTVGTVTAQLLYEIDSPRYLNPDAVLHVESIQVLEEAPDRIAMRGVRGSPPPPTTKVAVTTRGSFKNEMLFVAVGLDIEEKIALFERGVRDLLKRSNATIEIQRIGTVKPDADRQDEASVLLRVVATSTNEQDAGRAFSSALVELALSSYPGVFAIAPPGPANDAGRYWPTLISQSRLLHEVTLPDGTKEMVAGPPVLQPATIVVTPAPAPRSWGETRRAPLGTIVDARSGDKGSHANVGVWARSDLAFEWLRSELTTERFVELVPEAKPFAVDRYELPNLRGLNFLVRGILRGGAVASSRFDRQAKAFGEFLRSRVVEIPISLFDPGT